MEEPLSTKCRGAAVGSGGSKGQGALQYCIRTSSLYITIETYRGHGVAEGKTVGIVGGVRGRPACAGTCTSTPMNKYRSGTENDRTWTHGTCGYAVGTLTKEFNLLENLHNTDLRQSYQYTGLLLYVSRQLLASRAHVAMAGVHSIVGQGSRAGQHSRAMLPGQLQGHEHRQVPQQGKTRQQSQDVIANMQATVVCTP